MKKVFSLTSAAYTCQLEAARTFRFHGGAMGADLLPESALYAVCRFLRSSSALRGALLQESYKLRVATGKGRRSVRRSFVAPGPLMELPGAWVRVTLTVTAAGVSVTGVYLSERYPAPPVARKQR